MYAEQVPHTKVRTFIYILNQYLSLFTNIVIIFIMCFVRTIILIM